MVFPYLNNGDPLSFSGLRSNPGKQFWDDPFLVRGSMTVHLHLQVLEMHQRYLWCHTLLVEWSTLLIIWSGCCTGRDCSGSVVTISRRNLGVLPPSGPRDESETTVRTSAQYRKAATNGSHLVNGRLSKDGTTRRGRDHGTNLSRPKRP